MQPRSIRNINDSEPCRLTSGVRTSHNAIRRKSVHVMRSVVSTTTVVWSNGLYRVKTSTVVQLPGKRSRPCWKLTAADVHRKLNSHYTHHRARCRSRPGSAATSLSLSTSAAVSTWQPWCQATEIAHCARVPRPGTLSATLQIFRCGAARPSVDVLTESSGTQVTMSPLHRDRVLSATNNSIKRQKPTQPRCRSK